MSAQTLLLPSGHWVALITYFYPLDVINHPAVTAARELEGTERKKFLKEFQFSGVHSPAKVKQVNFLPVGARNELVLTGADIGGLQNAISNIPDFFHTEPEVVDAVWDYFYGQ